MSEPLRGELVGVAEKLAAIAAELRSRQAVAPTVVPAADQPLGAVAQALLDQRLERKNFLPVALFHEPAWELLLCLYVAHERGTPLSVKELVGGVDAPVTTSQRWIDQLVHMKLLNREVDSHDRRRLGITLSAQAVAAMERYLAKVAGDRTGQQS